MALGSNRGTAHATQDNAGEALGPGLRPQLQLVDLGDRGVNTRGSPLSRDGWRIWIRHRDNTGCGPSWKSWCHSGLRQVPRCAVQ